MSVIDERIADRRRAVREEDRRRRLRRTVAIVGVLLLLGVVAAVERSSLVGLEEIRVTGVERLDPEDVLVAADLELGTSTLRLGLRAAEARVEELPLVRHAHARRLDPLTVQFEIVERVPVLVATGDGEERAVDRDGVLLFDGGVPTLPRISLHGPPPAVGEEVSADPALANAFAGWHGLSGVLRSELVHLLAEGPEALTLELGDGTSVRIGRAERMDEKVRAIGAVRGDLAGTPVRAIDVRAPSAPVVDP